MLIKRAVILNVVLVLGFGTVLLLPKSYGIRDSAIVPVFPSELAEWKSFEDKPPEKVVDTLPDDTGHHRATFVRRAPEGGGADEFDQISVFMVVSGSDLNASIHRPERCFPAQGLTIHHREQKDLEVGERKLPVTVLDASGPISSGPFKGETLRQRAYYWFVGHRQITNSHWKRTMIDMTDRVLGGYNQRWAYIMISMNYGIEDRARKLRSGEEAGEIIEGLATKLFPHIHKLDEIKGG